MEFHKLCSIVVKELAKDNIYIPEEFGGGNIPNASNINFSEYTNIQNITRRWYIFSLWYIYYALRNSPSTDILQKCASIIHRLYEFSRIHDIYRIDRHSTSLRGITLTVFYSFNKSHEVENLLIEHANFLIHDPEYDAGWNHGFDADRSLLHIGLALHKQIYIDFALARLEKTLVQMVDDEGVTREQAIHYERYGYDIMCLVSELLHANNIHTLDDILARRMKMPEFLAHATMPDGCYAPIGDTFCGTKAVVYNGTIAEYPATLGKRGKKPEDTIKIYKDAGYIFGRSGWGNEDISFSEESFYSIHFGPGRYCHGHNDHMSFTYMANGMDIIVDSAYAGYHDGIQRKYFQHLAAHNVTFINDNRKFNWDNPTELLFSHVDDDFQSYKFEDIPYRHVRRSRSFLFHPKNNIIVILDSIKSSLECHVSQIFHFSQAFKVNRQESNSVSLFDGKVFANIKQLYPFDSMILNTSDQGHIRPFIAVGYNQIVDHLSLLTERSCLIKKPTTFLTVLSISSSNFLNVKTSFSSKGIRVHTVEYNNGSFKFFIHKDGYICTEDGMAFLWISGQTAHQPPMSWSAI